MLAPLTTALLRLAVLLSAVVVPLGLLLLFDTWTRYMLPIFPPAGVLCALGLSGALRWLARRRGPAPRLPAGRRWPEGPRQSASRRSEAAT